ncbi:bifunctional glycosyltransferase family 2/GtrA family protein [Cellulomonas fulva]|uniref:bifunctional glycosyltransferase family 2/GtrA family protein n=1 Tax=Cellulomonas fulva TaxID=2835530 RepID=UPI0027DDACFE|nr:bifunctional glycosyltransferase family 2/GtrA family protein [Cellulomonas fulva]
MVVLIPAYEPDERLVSLVVHLRAARRDLPVVVVDDGSGPAFSEVFHEVAATGATVLRHDENRGKGRALKTGFAHVAARHPGAPVVCADCDGQHTVSDVLVVADRAARGDADVVLGARRFTGEVPLRSRFGNAVTRAAFHLGTRHRVQDTQTGLRAYPGRVLPWLAGIGGERFEYELRVLLRAVAEGLTVVEVPIATVYLDANASSHFRPLVDSARVYAPLLRFAASSLTAFAVDALALVALVAATDALLLSVVLARVLSSGLNFVVNRRWVFTRPVAPPSATRGRLGREAARYWVLAAVLLGAGYACLWAFTHLGVPLLVAKAVTDLGLFVVGFQVQRSLVFAHRRDRSGVPLAGRHPASSAAGAAAGRTAGTGPGPRAGGGAVRRR